MEELDQLYATGNQENIQTAMAGWEEQGWTLRQVLDHVWEHHTEVICNDMVPGFPDEVTCTLGPLRFDFYTFLDDEAMDFETHYVTQLQVVLYDTDEKPLGRWGKGGIHTETIFKMFALGEADTDYTAARGAIREACLGFFAGIPSAEHRGLYALFRQVFEQQPGRVIFSELDLEDILRRVLFRQELVKPRPCTGSEIREVEERLGRPLPAFFVRYLSVVGLNPHLLSDMVATPQELRVRQEDYLVITSNATIGHETLISFSDEEPHLLYTCWTSPRSKAKIEVTIKTFEEWLLVSLEWVCKMNGV